MWSTDVVLYYRSVMEVDRSYSLTTQQCMTSVAVSRSRPRAAAGREFGRVRPGYFGPGRSRPGRYLFITAAAGCGQRVLEGSEPWIVYDM